MKTDNPGIEGTEFQITLHEQNILEPPISSLLITSDPKITLFSRIMNILSFGCYGLVYYYQTKLK